MIKTLSLSLSRPNTRDIVEVLLASLVIVFFAQVRIPYGPIPHTLQTFAIFVLALMMSPKKAMAACLCYLGYATVGLPIISGLVSKPLWFLGTTGGFLFGFPVAAYVISTVNKMWSRRNFLTSFISIFVGQVVLFSMGVSWLALFIGLDAAITFGLVPFILTEAIKNLAAAGLVSAYEKR